MSTNYDWEVLGASWIENKPQQVWRAHSDAVNRSLLRRWLATTAGNRLLKTDVFDEAVGEGLYPELRRCASSMVGIDVSLSVLRAAHRHYPDLSCICTDTRILPFANSSFDTVVSISTLDHFASVEQIAAALVELARVLRPGGSLVLTLDNLLNPVIALRAALPFSLLNRLGLVPYQVGATCGPRRLKRLVRTAGFDVVECCAVLHAPRVLAVALADRIERHTPARTHEAYLRLLRKTESLARLPTRFLTGHFVALLATKAVRAFPPATERAKA